jgi:hypothetical protein
MRKLFAVLIRSAFADRVSLSRKVFGKNPNNGTTKDGFFVEKLRGSLFDLFSQSEKLLHTRTAFCSLRSREFIERGIADLTHENLVVVQHGKPESVSVLVMSLDFVTDQRHGQHSPKTGAGSPRLPQPTSQINGLTATLSRKVLTLLIALVSIDFRVCSPASAGCNIGGGIICRSQSAVDSLGVRIPPMTCSSCLNWSKEGVCGWAFRKDQQIRGKRSALRRSCATAKSGQPNAQDADKLETAIDQAIAACNGDLRATVRALIVANNYLESEVGELMKAVSQAYVRARFHAYSG